MHIPPERGGGGGGGGNVPPVPPLGPLLTILLLETIILNLEYYCGGRAIGTYNNDIKILFTRNCLPVGIVEILYTLVAQQA